MLSEITSAFASIKAANDILKGFSVLKTEAAVNEKAIELQSIIFSLHNHISSLHSSYDEIVQEKRNLEQKIMDIEKWETTKQKYILKELNPGVFAYVHKEPKESVSDKHWYCANCFNAEQKESILQNRVRGETRNHVYACPQCGDKIEIGNPDYEMPDGGVMESTW
ncbi:MAG: hypothetical protein KKF62_01780 [Bacteroidetes bacterium]|nr:hypothetical protein [Bacteroidota bacterium]MBU1116338.1 hypothetical protein [Bacteroidota bacterium]MBU1796911.1 hypothetical protein [Bacteroidota bacterium]